MVAVTSVNPAVPKRSHARSVVVAAVAAGVRLAVAVAGQEEVAVEEGGDQDPYRSITTKSLESSDSSAL